MAGEDDSGIDKAAVLAEITGTSLPAVASPPPPPIADLLNSGGFSPAPVAPFSAAVAGPRRPPGPLIAHRHEIAGAVLAVIGGVWAAVGLATDAWIPGAIGGALAVSAIGAWMQNLLEA